MGALESRLDQWLAAVGDLLLEPSATFPRHEVRSLLGRTFAAEASWNEVRSDGTFEFELEYPRPGWPSAEEAELVRNGGLARNPLNRWYAATASSGPQTLARVPEVIASPADQAFTRSLLAPVGLEHSLCLPLRRSPDGIVMFVVARAGSDFTDDDMDLARRVQPLMIVLDRQVRELASRSPCRNNDVGLTGREQAVLSLLAEGLTAEAIARRLGASPRTVQKHLERVYRKLGVRERLSAVRTAEAAGLLPRSGSLGRSA